MALPFYGASWYIYFVMYSVYILENQNDRSWYMGFTSDLKRRVFEHQNGQGSRTTKLKHNWKLIYSESYINEKDARGRELFLKSGAGRRFLKKQLINYLSNLPPPLSLTAHL